MKVLLAVGLACIAGGIALTLTTHVLIGPILIIAGVAAFGRIAFAEGLTRIATFLSTGTWRRGRPS